MADTFYRAFEERFYAPRELIKQIRRQYLPFVHPLAAVYPGAATIDIGCGRGEWLELMAEAGFAPYGIDLDEGMLNACIELRLPAEQGDGLILLKSLAADSQAVVSAFHVVEHLSFPDLRLLVSEALRVLRPGGLLIMETPNPENLVVATKNFYLDPTHQRPIPPLLLAFLAEYCGFHKCKTLRLQESRDLMVREAPTLWDVLSGASPDFAVIAQKEPFPMQPFGDIEELFRQNFGIDLEGLAMRYEAGVSGKLSEIISRMDRSAEQDARVKAAESAVSEIGDQLNQLRQVQLQAETEIEHLRRRERLLRNELASNNSLLDQVARHTAKLRSDHEAVVSSRSWRLTRPLRAIAGRIRRVLRVVRGTS